MSTARAYVLDDVIEGLRGTPKRLPCRLLYDELGAELFDRITQLPEYYPYREELRLLDEHLPSIAAHVGAMARVIEPGAGAGIKTRRLLRALDRPASYVAIDVSAEQLDRTARLLHDEHPTMEVTAIAADFTRPISLPAPNQPIGKTLVFFPGSTIGNFDPSDAVQFLARFARLVGPGGWLLLGADGTRDKSELIPAYNDADGVTAEFDKNVLAHLNRTRGTDFDLDAFEHRAIWNDQRSRIEMHLVAKQPQIIRLGSYVFDIAAREPIVTEYAYKHSLLAMRGIVAAAGWVVREVYTASAHAMRLWLCEAAGTR